MTSSKEERLRNVAEKIEPFWFSPASFDIHVRASRLKYQERALAKAAEIEAEYAEEIGRLRADKERLDWLELQLVEARYPLPHGSRLAFRVSPDDSYEGEIGPSQLRAEIDAAREALALSTVVGGAGE